jgi:hypothetical protein
MLGWTRNANDDLDARFDPDEVRRFVEEELPYRLARKRMAMLNVSVDCVGGDGLGSVSTRSPSAGTPGASQMRAVRLHSAD